MPTKVSERKLLASIGLFVAGCLILLYIPLFAGPVSVSEKEMALWVLGTALIALALRLFRRSFLKV